MKKEEVTFQYKGDRDYIQGPDLFDGIMSRLGAQEFKSIRFSVHDFIKQVNCDLYTSTSKQDIDGIQGLAARCQMRRSEDICYMGLKASAEEDTQAGRYAYDEEVLIQKCCVIEESIVLNAESPFTFIETVVAMKKKLMEAMFPDVEGKWVFTRIDLPEYCDATSNLAIQFKHNMNFRLLKSDILVAGNKVGDLYFSLVKA